MTGAGAREGGRERDGRPILSHRVWNKLPATLFVLAGASDAFAWWSGEAVWHLRSVYAIGAGIVFTVPAAIFGVRDWIRIPEGRPEKTLAFHHGWLMLATVMTWITVGILRINAPRELSQGKAGLLVVALGLLVYGAVRGRGVVRSAAASKR